MKRKEKIDSVTVVLCFLSLVSSLSVDLYWPAIKLIREDFHCSELSMQIGMGINFMFPALVGFIYGYLADRFGRRPVLLLGTLILLLGNIGCFFAKDIFTFNTFRSILGFGAGAVSIIPSTIFVEQYSKNYAIRMISLNASFQALGLIIAPNIGALILRFFYWKVCFLFLICSTLIALLMLYTKLPETLDFTKEKRTNIKDDIIDYRNILKSKSFILNNLILSLPMGAFFVAALSLSFIYIEKLGMSPLTYAYFKTFGPIICFVVSFYTRSFIKKYGIESTIKWGITSTIIGSLFFIMSLCFADNNPYFITLSLTVYSFLFPILYPPIIGKILNSSSYKKCFVSSVCFNIRSFFVWMGTIISGLVYNGSLIPSAIILLLAAATSFMLYRLTSSSSTLKRKEL